MNDQQGWRSVSILSDSITDRIVVSFEANNHKFIYLGRCSLLGRDAISEMGRDASNPSLVLTWDDVAWVKAVLRDHFPHAQSKFVKLLGKTLKFFGG